MAARARCWRGILANKGKLTGKLRPWSLPMTFMMFLPGLDRLHWSLDRMVFVQIASLVWRGSACASYGRPVQGSPRSILQPPLCRRSPMRRLRWRKSASSCLDASRRHRMKRWDMSKRDSRQGSRGYRQAYVVPRNCPLDQVDCTSRLHNCSPTAGRSPSSSAVCSKANRASHAGRASRRTGDTRCCQPRWRSQFQHGRSRFSNLLRAAIRAPLVVGLGCYPEGCGLQWMAGFVAAGSRSPASTGWTTSPFNTAKRLAFTSSRWVLTTPSSRLPRAWGPTLPIFDQCSTPRRCAARSSAPVRTCRRRSPSSAMARSLPRHHVVDAELDRRSAEVDRQDAGVRCIVVHRPGTHVHGWHSIHR